MCGIAGLITVELPPAEAAHRARAMAERLRHRGPDADGVWAGTTADYGFTIALAHRRLSIIDLSERGNQPMHAADGRAVVVFNGEIYNFRDLRAELETAHGTEFHTGTDTEVLLAAYRAWGAAVVDRLVGMFAFAIWDAERQALFLARDRAGEKPLFYAHTPTHFAFASELSAICDAHGAMGGNGFGIDSIAVALYLNLQAIPAPHTIFAGISKLLPGHAMRWQAGKIETWRYWDPVPIAIGSREVFGAATGEFTGEAALESAVDALQETITEAVRGQIISDVPLGAFLSGGIDSTTVVGAMRDVSPGRVRTFTIGFEAADYDESAHAAAVAKHLGTEHTAEFLTERDALDLIPSLPAMYGEPFADASALPTHLVSRIARGHVTVALTGDGGDELFGGYANYDRLEKLAPWVARTRPIAPLAKFLLRFAPAKYRRGATLLGQSPADVFWRCNSLFLPEEVAAMLGAVPPMVGEFARAWDASHALPLRRRAMLSDMLTYLPEALLVKVDRAAMAVSLETRAPLLDHRVMEFALRLPHELAVRKRVLKQLAYRYVPREMLDRPKMGFGVPLDRWFRGQLRDLLLDTITPANLRRVGIADFRAVKKFLDAHLAGRQNHGHRLWGLLVLALWAQSRATNAGTNPA